jgi:hypothetical protein
MTSSDFYSFGVGTVVLADINIKKLKLKMWSDNPILAEVEMFGESGFLWIRPYTSAMTRGKIEDNKNDVFRFGDEDIWSNPSGFINFPRIGDILFVAVPVHIDTNSNIGGQNLDRPVLIMGYIQIHPSAEYNVVDNIWLDRSGAKIHFNHIWNDQTNLIQEQEPDTGLFTGNKIPNYTGHLTILGNRVARIAGKNFLPFGLLSHKYDEDGTELVFESLFEKNVNAKRWGSIFTRDFAANKFHIMDLAKTRHQVNFATTKLLEPPPPPLNSLMDFHESGYKKLVYANGNLQEFLRARLRVVGADYFPFSYAPTGLGTLETEILETPLDATDVTRLQQGETQANGLDLEYQASSTAVTGKEINARGDGLKEELRDGVVIHIPNAKKTKVKDVQDHLDNATEKAESGKYKIVVEGGSNDVIIEIDKTGEKVTMTNGQVTLLMSGGTVDVS